MKNKKTKTENKTIDPIQRAKWDYARRIAEEYHEIGVRGSILDAFQAGADEVQKRNTPVKEVFSKEDDDLAVSDATSTSITAEIAGTTGRLLKLLETYTNQRNEGVDELSQGINQLIVLNAQAVICEAIGEVVAN